MNSIVLDALPANEDSRLRALRRLGILHSERSTEFDALVEAAAAVMDCPIAMVSFVDEHEQWLKAFCGLDFQETPRKAAICRHTILSPDLLVVRDLAADPRFQHDRLMVEPPHVRFYAGCPLSIDGIHRLGSLCVMHTEPRDPTPSQLQQLRRLGVAVEGLIRAYAAQAEAATLREDAVRQQALVETQSQLLAQTTSISGVGGWELDLERDTLLWTDQVRRLLEVDDDYVPDLKEAFGFFRPEARGELRRALDNARLRGFPFSLELLACTAKGRERWVRLAGKPTMREDRTLRIVGAIRDVTDRKTAEIRLQHSEALYRTTLLSLSEGVIVADADGRILSHNPAALAMLGLDGQDITGRELQTLDLDFLAKDGGQGSLGNLLARGVADPASLSSTVAGLRLGDGVLRWLNLNAVAYSGPGDGAGGGAVISLTDVTETVRQAVTLEGVFRNYPGAVVYFDQDLVVAGWNRAFETLLDVPPDYLRRRPSLADYVLMNAERGEYGEGDPRELARQRLETILGGPEHAYERSRPNGMMLDIRGTFLPGGGLLSTFTDISDRKRIERQLIENARVAREKSDELETVLANMNQGVSVFDRDGRLTLWNEQYVSLFGFEPDAIAPGRPFRELVFQTNVRQEAREEVEARITMLMRRMEAGETMRSTFRLKTGRIISTVHAPLPDGGWVGTHEDVTERELAADKVLHAARHDTLTGLANRTYLNEQLEKLATGEAPAEGCLGILMLVDLDRFKPVNDALGHNAGDAVLCEVARRLRLCVRESDFVARIGGDEFAVLLLSGSGLTWPSDLAEAAARRILSAMSTRFAVEGSSIQIGASIGIAPILPGAEMSELLRHADAALYQVKHQGRNGFRIHEPPVDEPAGAAQVIAWPGAAAAAAAGTVAPVLLRPAPSGGELLFQPIVCLRSRELRGYQALQHLPGQTGGAGDVAQDTAAVEAATAGLLREALSAAVRLPDAQMISLSLGARQFGLETLAATIEREIAAAGIDPGRLHLQVADGYFLLNSGAASGQFEALRDIGVRLVLDRFGAEASCLKLLSRFRFDSLRIDGCSLQDILAGGRGAAAIRALVAVAETLGVPVGVEGVDSEERASLLSAAGCVQGQGRLFGAPEPIEAFLSVA